MCDAVTWPKATCEQDTLIVKICLPSLMSSLIVASGDIIGPCRHNSLRAVVILASHHMTVTYVSIRPLVRGLYIWLYTPLNIINITSLCVDSRTTASAYAVNS